MMEQGFPYLSYWTKSALFDVASKQLADQLSRVQAEAGAPSLADRRHLESAPVLPQPLRQKYRLGTAEIELT